MDLYRGFVNGATRLGLETMCRIEKSDLKKIPDKGPLIVYSNHTAMLEAPIIFTELLPRPMTGIAKVESWDGWFLRWIFNLWGIIPIRRGEADMKAMRISLDALKRGMIVGMAPEGTRNRTGALLRAQPGVVMLALKGNTPLIPLAHWGGEKFSKNLKRLKRTDFHMRVGQPFVFDARGEKITKEVRQQMADEMMYKLAEMLPPEYRGAYADLDKATEKYLLPVFLD
jgi:1-acyl-sn-glycerol-3-phosphate acyltransferase